ncbi:involucrin-like isoform X3 [Lucilia sericata]|uniref:involucrin-like isoform X3 n=1 Tax=Lucilia sericata TaxID=13632 RepID=UPI0018A86342|nr:involucrin-like isoform X3 [Lucilia sericata]XP_037824037.1 involucrin-like isoform X3 [Lucilia sericata]XP_037824038.1 involucrin-like isoform X3 [Lucilia sericata]XP_037824039.1 involucrin-like isoform X3 [Lucilia sericata]
MENKSYEQELHDLDSKTLENINENLKEQHQMRRKLELESKLYGKWRDEVDEDNLVFESKSDNEVLAKHNWLGKQVDHQERQLKLHHEVNKIEEQQKERELIREKEIGEIRYLQEYHMNQLRGQQMDIDVLKEKELQLKANLIELEKELELLEESYSVLSKPIDVGNASNLYKVKILMRNRSELFRNQIKLCLSILERSTKFAENSRIINNLKDELNQQLNVEKHKLSQLENMHESEGKYHLQCNEEIWQQENKERYEKLKEFIMEEHLSIKTSLNDIMKRHEEFLEIRATHLGIIENSSEKLKFVIQDEEKSSRNHACTSSDAARHVPFSARHIIKNQKESANNTPHYSQRHSTFVNTLELDDPQHQLDSSIRHNTQESYDNNMSPRHKGINQVSESFTILNLDVSENQLTHLSHGEIESEKSYAQRSLQVVTPETEEDRPRFGRKHVDFD